MGDRARCTKALDCESVRTGKKLWQFNTIPRPGEFGNDTWLNGSWANNGNAGVWTQIGVDEELGLAYLPAETPASDFYGGHRPGNNLFADSPSFTPFPALALLPPPNREFSDADFVEGFAMRSRRRLRVVAAPRERVRPLRPEGAAV